MMMGSFATTEDLKLLFRHLSQDEEEKAERILEIVSAELRSRARAAGKDLDHMISVYPPLAEVARSVACDVTARTLMTKLEGEPLSQFSESAGGYSLSGTYLVPGGGLFIKKSELARLGIRRQKIGGFDIYDEDSGNIDPSI